MESSGFRFFVLALFVFTQRAKKGNLGNVMIQEMKVGPPRVVAIDNVGHSLVGGARDAYLASVRALVADVAAGVPHASFDRVGKAIGRDCGREIQAAFQRALSRTQAVAEDVLVLARAFSSNDYYQQQLSEVDMEVSFLEFFISFHPERSLSTVLCCSDRNSGGGGKQRELKSLNLSLDPCRADSAASTLPAHQCPEEQLELRRHHSRRAKS